MLHPNVLYRIVRFRPMFINVINILAINMMSSNPDTKVPIDMNLPHILYYLISTKLFIVCSSIRLLNLIPWSVIPYPIDCLGMFFCAVVSQFLVGIIYGVGRPSWCFVYIFRRSCVSGFCRTGSYGVGFMVCGFLYPILCHSKPVPIQCESWW